MLLVWLCAALSGWAQAPGVVEAVRAGAGQEREKRETVAATPESPPEPPLEWTVETKLKARSPDYVGKAQGELDVRAKNAWVAEDQFDASHSRSLDYDRNRQASDYTSGAYRRPFGSWWAKVGGDTGYYAVSFPNGTGGESTYSGTYRSLYGMVGRTMKLSGKASWDAAGKVTWKDSAAEFDGVAVESARNALAILSLEAGYSLSRKSDYWWGRVYVMQGTPWFGAFADEPGLPDDAPRAEALWARVEGGYSTWFPVAGRWITLSTQAKLQVADEPLYGSERISVAGNNGVRGYDSYGADAGVYVRQSVSHSVTLGKTRKVDLIPSVAVEAARSLDAVERAKAPASTLCGATLALDLKGRRWSVRTEVSDAVFPDSALSGERRVAMEARWRF